MNYCFRKASSMNMICKADNFMPYITLVPGMLKRRLVNSFVNERMLCAVSART